MTTTRDTAATARDEAGAIAGTAKDEATNVATTTVDAAKGVAQTAAQTTSDVVGEAARQARDLVGETRQQVRAQAETQTQRLAENARTIAGEISGMAAKSEQQGPATEIAQQLAGKVESLAGYLEGTTPEAVVDDLRTFARRRPGLFLLGAGAVGFLAGRMLKGATSSGTEEQTFGSYGTPTGTGMAGAPGGTATGQPTAGLDLTTTGVLPGATPIPAATPFAGPDSELSVDPYPAGMTADAPLGSADFRGTGNPNV